MLTGVNLHVIWRASNCQSRAGVSLAVRSVVPRPQTRNVDHCLQGVATSVNFDICHATEHSATSKAACGLQLYTEPENLCMSAWIPIYMLLAASMPEGKCEGLIEDSKIVQPRSASRLSMFRLLPQPRRQQRQQTNGVDASMLYIVLR